MSTLQNVFFPDLAFELPKYTKINDYTIKLVNDQQLPYKPIYSLGPVELETLKTYIGTNLANEFIRPLNYPQMLSFFLIGSQTFFSGCISIIKISITS